MRRVWLRHAPADHRQGGTGARPSDLRGYDLVFVDAEATHAAEYAEQGIRLLRPSGLLIMNDALDHDRLPRPAVREESTQQMRQLERRLLEDDRLCTSMLGAGTGLLVAARR